MGDIRVQSIFNYNLKNLIVDYVIDGRISSITVDVYTTKVKWFLCFKKDLTIIELTVNEVLAVTETLMGHDVKKDYIDYIKERYEENKFKVIVNYI